jgi:sulfonate transport system permease protein
MNDEIAGLRTRELPQSAVAGAGAKASDPRKSGTLSPQAVATLAASSLPTPAPRWRRGLRRSSDFWLLGLFIVIWQLVSVLGQRVNPQLDIILPPPTAIFSAAASLLARGVLLTDIGASLRRVLLAVGVAALLGIPLGLAMGWSGRLRRSAEPLIEFIRPIPPLAWIPLSILWFGIGDIQNEYIIFLAAFFPIVLNSMAGARDVDKYLLRAALSLGAGPRDLFLTVVLPGSLPSVFTGLRVGLGIGWMALVAGELVAAPTGLGHMINDARTLFRSDYILLGMVLIGVLGLILDTLMRRAAWLIMPWYRDR